MIHLILRLTRQGLYIVKDDYFRKIMSKLHFFVEYVSFLGKETITVEDMWGTILDAKLVRTRWLAKVDPLVVEDM